ncbi:hypothetical protein OH76DRAFT_118661 [Lentinus brumalis]|uniref:F-box domain-containing protein n=1 Tax=Lentinus brumalis TaxID=2498619 RepID=A0A371DJI2_9APHY|nr:hypothetical protein OH76DRAFT_118661 [Polyporus brumalis]
MNKSRSQCVHTRKKSRRGSTGSLSGLLNVPLDIFFEIACHLEPLDILQLSRTSKALRRLLLSRTSRHIWITARKRIAPRALPDAPAGLSEPLYAALVFQPTCMACGSRALSVDYALQVRFCRPCWNENVIRGKDLAKAALEDYILDEFFSLLPAETRPRHTLTRKDDRSIVHVEAVKQTKTDRYYWIEFSAIAEQYRQVCELRDEQGFGEFVVERSAVTLARLNFHRDLLNWEHDRMVYRHHMSGHIHYCIDLWTDAIKTRVDHRLEEYGYEVADYPSRGVDPEFYMLRYDARYMKPRIWQIIRPKLLEHLEAERSRREKAKWKKRRDLLRGYYRSFRRSDRVVGASDIQKRTLANFEDASQLPCMRALLVAQPPHVGITEAQFAKLEPTILTESQVYSARVHSDLVKLVLARYPDRTTGTDGTDIDPYGGNISAAQLALLEDPTTLFRCGLCSCSMSYLGILEHWQTVHTATPWASQHVQLPLARSVSRLLTALSQNSRLRVKTHSKL